MTRLSVTVLCLPVMLVATVDHGHESDFKACTYNAEIIPLANLH